MTWVPNNIANEFNNDIKGHITKHAWSLYKVIFYILKRA